MFTSQMACCCCCSVGKRCCLAASARQETGVEARNTHRGGPAAAWTAPLGDHVWNSIGRRSGTLRRGNRPLGMYTELLALTACSVLCLYTPKRADASGGRGRRATPDTPCAHFCHLPCWREHTSAHGQVAHDYCLNPHAMAGLGRCLLTVHKQRVLCHNCLSPIVLLLTNSCRILLA